MDEGRAEIVDPTRKHIDWDEFLSVIVQTLLSLGFVHIAERLESEIDISNTHQPLKFVNLRSQFLGGFWEKCAETLCSIDGLNENENDVSGAMQLILSMWLVERVDFDRSFNVSNVFNNTYASRLSVPDRNKMKEVVTEIRRQRNVLNDVLKFRKNILKRLESRLPSVVPTLNDKLLALIKYGVFAQIYSCPSHNTKDVINPIYCDHSCSEDQLPAKTIKKTDHKGVWCVKFSHKGLYLASGSVDGNAIIWEVSTGWELKQKHVLPGHSQPITCVSWSPNDESLLTCAQEEHIKIWDVITGQCTRVISEGGQVLRSCAFLSSDPIKIVYGTSLSKSIRLLTNEGDSELVPLPRPEGRLTIDLAVTPNGRKLIYYNYTDEEGFFYVKHIDTGSCESSRAGARIRGIFVSEDSESLILNLINHEIRVWDLNKLDDRPLIYWNFEPITDGNFSCFGGLESRFLASGTADSKVCIWNRKQARPIAVLSGHTLLVRCVSWNPERPQMLASASDDDTIRIWGPQSQEVPRLLRHD